MLSLSTHDGCPIFLLLLIIAVCAAKGGPEKAVLADHISPPALSAFVLRFSFSQRLRLMGTNRPTPSNLNKYT